MSFAVSKELKPPSACRMLIFRYIEGMNWLTKQEQFIICIVIGLLVTGLAVKYYRAAHPAITSSQPVKN